MAPAANRDQRAAHLLPTARKLAVDPDETVRILLPPVIVRIFLSDHAAATEVAELWLDHATDITLRAMELDRLAWQLLAKGAASGNSLTERMITSPIADVRTRGGALAALASLRRGSLPPGDEAILPEVVLGRAMQDVASRKGVVQLLAQSVDQLSTNSGGETAGDVEAGRELLIQLLDDDDHDVRESAVRYAFDLTEPLSRYSELLAATARSRAFREHPTSTLHTLHRLSSDIPLEALDLCEEWLGHNSEDAGDIRKAAAGDAYYVVDIVLSIHSSSPSGSSIRERCTALIEAVGVDQGRPVLQRTLETFGFGDPRAAFDGAERQVQPSSAGIGGTGSGLTNGANDKGTYQPIVTSYDCDAPLDEAGRPTAKYRAFRDGIARYAPTEPVPAAAAARVTAPPPMPLERSVALWEVLDLLGEPMAYDRLPTTDEIGHFSGFTLYTAHLPHERGGVLAVAEVRDRAQVFVGGIGHGVLSRDHGERMIGLAGGPEVDLLVEDLGRVNYGPRIGEPKGLIGPATLDGTPVRRWTVRPLALDRIGAVTERLHAGSPVGASLAGPVFALARFDAPEPEADLFLDTTGWTKGIAWINGFCLGAVLAPVAFVAACDVVVRRSDSRRR